MAHFINKHVQVKKLDCKQTKQFEVYDGVVVQLLNDILFLFFISTGHPNLVNVSFSLLNILACMYNCALPADGLAMPFMTVNIVMHMMSFKLDCNGTSESLAYFIIYRYV